MKLSAEGGRGGGKHEGHSQWHRRAGGGVGQGKVWVQQRQALARGAIEARARARENCAAAARQRCSSPPPLALRLLLLLGRRRRSLPAALLLLLLLALARPACQSLLKQIRLGVARLALSVLVCWAGGEGHA